MTTLTALLALALAAIGAAVASYFKGVKAGRKSEVSDRIIQDANRQAEFEAIDSARPDLDGALGRLRNRARSDGVPEAK